MLYSLMFPRVPEGAEQRPLHNTGMLWESRHFNDQARSGGGWRNRVGGGSYGHGLPGWRDGALQRHGAHGVPQGRNGSSSSAARGATEPVRQRSGKRSGKAFEDVEGEPGAGRLTLKSGPRLRSVVN